MTIVAVLGNNKLEFSSFVRRAYEVYWSTLQRKSLQDYASYLAKLSDTNDMLVLTLNEEAEQVADQYHLNYVSIREVTENWLNMNSIKVGFEWTMEAGKLLEEATDLLNDDLKLNDLAMGISMWDMTRKDLFRAFFQPIAAFNYYLDKYIGSRKVKHVIVNGSMDVFQRFLASYARSKNIRVKELNQRRSKLIATGYQNMVKTLAATTRIKLQPPTRKEPKSPKKNNKPTILILIGYFKQSKVKPIVSHFKKNGYNVVYVALNEDYSAYEKAGATVYTLNDFMNPSLQKEINTHNNLLSIAHSNFAKSKFHDKFKLDNIDLTDATKECFSYVFKTRFHDIITLSRMINHVFETIQPDVWIGMDDLSHIGRTTVEIANKHNTPSILVQHGSLIGLDFLSPTKATMNAAWGDFTKKELAKVQTPQSKLKVIGQVDQYDNIDNESKALNETRKKFGFDSKPIVTFASQGISDSYRIPLLNAVYKSMKENPDANYVVKLHPTETADLHNIIMAQYGLNVATTRDYDLAKLLLSSKAVLNFYSSVGFECFKYHALLISVNVQGLEDVFFPPIRKDISVMAKSQEELSHALSEVIRKNVTAKLKKEMATFDKFFVKARGKQALLNLEKEVVRVTKKSKK